MAAELLKNLTGIDIVHVPYKGSTGMRIDILSGQIQMLFDSIPTMAPYIKAGKVRALGTSGTVRSPILPDVPTIAEAGVPGFQFSQWVGFMAPKGTPQPIIDLLTQYHRRDFEPARHQRSLGEARRDPDGDDATRIRGFHGGPGREMG